MQAFPRISLLLLASLSLFAQPDIYLDRNYLPDVYLYGIVKNESLYVAVGQNGLILTSTDAVNWEPRHVITNLDFIDFFVLRSVAWNGNFFLAAGDFGRIHTSKDGVSWAGSFTPSYSHIRSVIWNGNNFIGVGDGISVTPNGSDWMEQDPQASLFDVACANGLCIAVGTDGAVFKSTDDVNWSNQPPFTSGNLIAIDTLGTTFIATSLSKEVFSSTDGMNWTLIHTLVDKPEALHVANGRAVILQEGGNLAFSEDGVTWVDGKSGLEKDVTSFLWDGERYVGVGIKGHLIYGKSMDAWWSKLRDEVIPRAYFPKHGPVFMMQSQLGLMTSGCARSWRKQANPVPGFIESVDNLGSGFIAAGENGTLIVSPDGYNWEAIPFVNNQTITHITVGDISMVAHGPTTYARLLTDDHWQPVDPSILGLRRSIWVGQEFIGMGFLASRYSSRFGFEWRDSGAGGIIDNNNSLYEGVDNAVILSYFEDHHNVQFWILKNSATIASGSLSPYTRGWRWMDDHFLAVGYHAFKVDEQGNQTPLSHPWGIGLMRPIVSGGRAYAPYQNTNFEYIFDPEICECPIYREPENTLSCQGSTARISVYSDQPASYQWRKEGIPIPGANEATLTIPSMMATDVGGYDCVVQTECFTVTSARVRLEEGPGVEIHLAEPSTSIFGEPLLSATFSCDPVGLSWYWRDITNNLAFGFNQQTVRVPPATSPRFVEVVVSVPGLLGTARDQFLVNSVDPIWIDPNGDGCRDFNDWLFLFPLWGNAFPDGGDPNRDGRFDVRDFLYIPNDGTGCADTLSVRK